MTKAVKISLITSAILLVGYVVYINRKPKLKILGGVNWADRKVEVKFGNKTAFLRGSGKIDAGLGFSKRFSLKHEISGDKMIISLISSKSGDVIEEKVVDFRNKLIY